MKTNTRLWTIIIALVVVFAGAFGILVIGGEAATAKANGGLNVVTNYNIGHEVSEIWGENATHVWKQATLTGAGTDAITATFPVDFKAVKVIIMTDNSSQSVYNLLTKSAYYEYMDLTSVDGKITNLNQYYGEYNCYENDSSNKIKNEFPGDG